jgi:hypothetical protein
MTSHFGVRLIMAATALLALPTGNAAVHAQAARAEANQLHAAIENGDVEALRYWLTARHVDPDAPNADQPDVTPLARCLVLASRVLDGPSATPAPPGAPPSPGLRTLQDMVALLDAHGATLAEPDRRRFSAPVLRWYDDAVGHAAATDAPAPTPAIAGPPPPAVPSKPASPQPPEPEQPSAAAPATPPSWLATVSIAPDPKKPCNGTGHRVFLQNGTTLAIVANVTTSEDATAGAKARSRTHRYAVDPQGVWELGCDVSAHGATVRYELTDWK